jgi:hypothetical protein
MPLVFPGINILILGSEGLDTDWNIFGLKLLLYIGAGNVFKRINNQWAKQN